MGNDDLADQVLALLEREGRALREGDFGELAGLVARKEAACEALAGAGALDRGGIERLARLAARNEALLAAARGGLRGALDRMGAVAAAGAGLRTYDKSGASTVLGRAEGAIRRA